MTSTLITCQLQPVSELPRDVAINTFALTVDDGAATEPIGTAFQTFYQDISPWLGPSIKTSDSLIIEAAEVDLPTGDVSPAVLIHEGDLAGVGGDPLPVEVATCLSFRSTGSGSTARRSRGRIYIGPLNTDTVAPITPAAGQANLASAWVTALTTAASELLNNLLPDALWCVWSRMDHDFHLVTDGWVDNEFDTMRTRGRRASVRVPWA